MLNATRTLAPHAAVATLSATLSGLARSRLAGSRCLGLVGLLGSLDSSLEVLSTLGECGLDSLVPGG